MPKMFYSIQIIATTIVKMRVALLLILILLCCPVSFSTILFLLDRNKNITDDDGAALMSFKSLITHDPFGALSSWSNRSLHFCKWQGVACIRYKGRLRVTTLNLQDLELVGSLSPSLGNLTFLRRLHLPENRLYGPIPNEIGMLSNIHHLNLSYNRLEGIIPPTLSQLCSPHLQTISLRNNTLYGEIPANLSRCLGLQIIDFENNFFNGIIPSSLGALRDLIYLALGNNHLEGANLAFLSALSNCTNLQVLDLTLNILGGALPSSIGNLSTSLKYLGMYGTQISGIIPPSIGSLINLEQLYLNNNLLHGIIPHEIGNLWRLRFLSMSFNQLSGTLPSSLQNISGLEGIYLYENSLGGSLFSIFDNFTFLLIVDLSENNFIGHVPSFFGSQSSLRYLILDSNKLIGNIPPSLGNLYSLNQLMLSQNDLIGVVPNSLWNQTFLETLNLGENNLFGVIPPNICQTIPNLQYLILYKNRFYGPIPDALINCSSLEEIVLEENTFTGRIPKNLGILKSLRYVLLSGNKLEAGQQHTDWTFLKSLVNCTKLNTLYLARNHLSGILPGSIANLSKTLTFLGLEENGLHGNIPAEINNLIGLGFLLLHHNRFTGIIPETIGSLPSLYSLYLYMNELSGEIPSSIGNLTKLGQLSLGYNYLNGRIPASLGNCMHLEVLNLQNNRLIGSIPSEVMNISSLSRGLVLSNNSFTGALPSTIRRLVNLEFLYVAGNRLSGPIPEALGKCTQLRYIEFYSNLFEGTIPLSLSDLRGLEELELSNNKLSGEIPKFLETFKFLKYLNLSYNHFEGKVPTKGIFSNASLFSVIENKNLCGGIYELNLLPCPTINVATKKHHTLTVDIIVAVSVVICFVIFISIFSVWRYKPSKLFSSIKRITRLEHMKVSYADLRRATDGFAPRNLIGAGSFGLVYKGNMEFYYSHQNIAIKVLNLQQFGASRSFDIECKVLRSIRHRNLLKVLTSCSSTDNEGNDFKALIFQYMPNGSLDEWLHPQSHGNRRSLTLIQRINIAIDITCALEYLHCHEPMPIIHCDLKPSNVLLDHDMVAHVGDFGMTKLLMESATSSQILSESALLKGTIGYIAPEYGMGNQVSIKGDIYSFGILLLEVFTGKRPTDQISFKDCDIHHFVQLALCERVADILDPQLLSQEEDVEGNSEIQHVNCISKYGLECIVSLLQIGLRCSNELPAERMEIEKVSTELHTIRNIFLKQELARC